MSVIKEKYSAHHYPTLVRRFQARYWSWVKYPYLSLFFFFNEQIDVYEFVYVAKFFHHRSFVFFQTLCDSVHFVTSDWASLHLFVETSTSGSRRFKQYAPCSVLVSSCFWFRSHNFSFIIQFTSNRLLLHNYHHIILPQLLPILYKLPHLRWLPFHIYEFVYNTNDYH